MADFTADRAEAGRRLDHVLHERLPQYSRSRIQQWIRDGRVLVNGTAARASYTVRGGEAIQVEPAEPPPLRAEPEEIPLTILYEDDDVVAVDKPAGMVVHAGAGVHSGTLVNALLHRFGALSAVGGEMRPGIVHRLDRYTSGVILVAKNDTAHRKLAAQFSGRRVEKVYLALVHGAVKQESGVIDKPDRTRPSPPHPHDGAPPRRTRGAHRISRHRAPSRLHVSGSENRHRPHPPDPRPSVQHRPPRRRRHAIRRARPSPRPPTAWPLFPARPPHPLLPSRRWRTRHRRLSAAARVGRLGSRGCECLKVAQAAEQIEFFWRQTYFAALRAHA